MALQYGLNFPSSNIKQILEQNDKQQSGVRSWRQLFGGASLGFGKQSDALTTDYSSAMAQAYRANFEQNTAIMSGGLSAGGTKQLLSMSRQELSKTYDMYLSNYGKDLSNIAEGYSEEVGMINNALYERADNISKMLGYAQQYYDEELYGSSRIPEGQTDALSYFADKGLDWLNDKEKLSQNIIAEDGSLTDEGVEFFDTVMNARPDGFTTESGEATRGFDKWLSDMDPELREWLVSQDDFNYNFEGSNFGTIKTLLGRDSTNQIPDAEQTILSNISRSDGYNKFVNKVNGTLGNNALSKLNSKKQNKDIAKNLQSMKNQSYDSWFSEMENRLNDNSFWTGGISDRLKHDFPEIVNAYIQDYKSTTSNEINTFRQELTTLLGTKMAEEFWSQYGGTIDKLSKQVFEWQGTERYFETGNYKNWLRTKLDDVNKLKNLGMEEALQDAYKNLQKYLNRKSKGKSKTSGF